MEDFHIKRFEEIIQTGEINKLCEKRPPLKVLFPVLRRVQFREMACCNHWKLLQKKTSGHWLIIDPSGHWRVQGKNIHHLNEFFRGHPVSLKENRSWKGNRFFYYPGTNGETVILIHGWSVRASFFSQMAEFLQSNGYTVLNYDYATETLNIRNHVAQFLALMRSEQITGKIHYVVHSMGGLVIRNVLANMSEAECLQIDSIVMLAPANQGSYLAVPGKLLFRNDRALGNMIPGSEALKIPSPPHYPPVGIIAAEYDGKVSFKRTGIPGNVPFQRITVKSNHPDIRFPRISGEWTLKFIREKKFF